MRIRLTLVALLGLSLWQPLQAEPWIAVQQGMKCSNCHVNPTGGGMRNAFGNLWAQRNLPANELESREEMWTGMLQRSVAIGGNLRGDATRVDVPEQDHSTAFQLREARLYLDFRPVSDRLAVYLDQSIAPGGSQNREAYVRYRTSGGNWTFKAGQMYLPYGLRLQDDTAFIRQAPGINFTTPDRGVEAGWESGVWSIHGAVSEGVPGDNDKQFSLRASHVLPGWRFGASFNHTGSETGDRRMQNLFAGFRTGPVTWLAELDQISDDSFPNQTLEQTAALLEANWWLRQGHNLKITAERLDPDTDVQDNSQTRYSLVWEYFPLPLTQLRFGARVYDGIQGVALPNREVIFAEVHGFF